MSQARARKGRACWPESGPGATHSAAVGRGLARRALVYYSFVVGVHWCFPLVYSLSPSLQKRGRLGTSLALYPLLHRPHRGTCPAGRQTGLRPRLAHGILTSQSTQAGTSARVLATCSSMADGNAMHCHAADGSKKGRRLSVRPTLS